MKDDVISRQAAIDAMINSRSNADVTLVPGSYTNGWIDGRKLLLDELLQVVFELPSAQPEIIHCRDCKNWDTTWQNDFAPNYHYCPFIDGTRRDDFYCADAERREDGQTT